MESTTLPSSTTPAEAGAQLGDIADMRCASLLQPTQMDPGLRRGGKIVWLRTYNPTASLLNKVQLTGVFP